MSGIFGVYTNNRNDAPSLHGALCWNRAYGTENSMYDSTAEVNNPIYSNGSIQFGCCLESLSKYFSCNQQAVLHSDNKSAVLDCLIFNHEELAKKCQLNSPVTDEVLLINYINSFGFDALSNVNGDFSGAVYDKAASTLTLFRDHMGVRPLYYYADADIVAFSTDLRGLIAIDGVDASINEDWIYKTCAGSYINNVTETEFKYIFCIPPGNYTSFRFEERDIKIIHTPYWKLRQKRIRYSSLDDYKNALRELVTDSVKRRLDVIPGLISAELSGGLDSSVIDILISRLGRKCIHFSWSVDPSEVPYAPNDERLVIEDICRQENITCGFSTMREDRGVNHSMHRRMKALGLIEDSEEPLFLRCALPPYINVLTLCEASDYAVKNGSRVVFTGHGGDEGISHRCNHYELFYHHEYLHYFRYFWDSTKGRRLRILRTLKKGLQSAYQFHVYYKKPFHMPFCAPCFLNRQFDSLYKFENMPSLPFAYDAVAYINAGGSKNRLDNASLLGAYNGVRYLIPYLDYRVIDFAVSIPRHLYLKDGMNRYLFRETFKDIMPESLYSLRFKEDNSHQNYKEDPNWFDEFAKMKQTVYEQLDKNYWSQYLDFDEIDTWMQQGQPAEEDRLSDKGKLFALSYLAEAANLVKKARAIK